MNHRQKIIVNVIGIFIVLITLVGITYAYFLTRIQGNTNTTSISVNTAKLELVYGDNIEEIIQSTDALIPSTDLTSTGAIGTKTFTVTNNGNDSSYVVIIDNVSVTKASDGSSTSFVSNDFRYTLSCTKSDGTKCNEVSDLTIFPIKGGILVSNDIKEEDVHTYTLTMWYIDTGVDQSDDMGKSYQARVNIADVNQMENPFKTGVSATDSTNLAYNIINNAKANKNGTTFVNTPLTTPAIGAGNKVFTSYTDPTSFSNTSTYKSKWYVYGNEITIDKNGYFKIINPQVGNFSDIAENMINGYTNQYYGYNTEEDARKNINNEFETIYKIGASTTTSKLYYSLVTKNNENIESVLSVTTDDYGTSYYFRGGVTDNYVNFAGLCWRIVRIEGDGSIKLILEDYNQECDSKNADGTLNMDGNWTDDKRYVFGYAEDSEKSVLLNFLNYNGGLADSFATFQNTLEQKISEKYDSKTITDKLKKEEWCYDDRITSTDTDGNEHHGAYTRIEINKQPSLICGGTKLTKFKDNTNMYVGTLTGDEIVFAGALSAENYTIHENYNYYLINNYSKSRNNEISFWSLSPDYFTGIGGSDGAFYLEYNGMLNGYSIANDCYSRPAITLKSGIMISGGEGTQAKPYIIS